MQAPTAPGQPPAPEPGEVLCPACGAANGRLAAFCWRCYRPFAGRAPMPPTSRLPGPPSPLHTPAPLVGEPMPAPYRSRNPVGALAVIAVVVAAIGAAAFLLTRGNGVDLPESFAGLSRIENEQVDLAVDLFRDAADGQGVEGDMALYGGGGIPGAALVWVRDATVPTTDEAFAAFSDGFNTGLTGGLDPTRMVSETVDGVEYVCASVASVPPAGICMWQDHEVFWLLFDLQGAGRTHAARDLAVAAHDVVA